MSRTTRASFAIGLVAVAVLVWAVLSAGAWLVVADPLDHARAVVVLGGHAPFRAVEAAALYLDGWAPEVWLTQADRTAPDVVYARLHMAVTAEHAISREVLERSGVPAASIRVLTPAVHNTRDELLAVARALHAVGGRRVIIVTSKPHTRRVRSTWRTLVGSEAVAVVRSAASDPFQPDRWWTRSADALAVSREIFGLVNVWAAFPVEPDRSVSRAAGTASGASGPGVR